MFYKRPEQKNSEKVTPFIPQEEVKFPLPKTMYEKFVGAVNAVIECADEVETQIVSIITGSVKKCRCGASRSRHSTIVGPFILNPENPDRPIFPPRRKFEIRVNSIPIIGWLLGVDYSSRSGWYLSEMELQCPNKKCEWSDELEKVKEGKHYYRKFCRARWWWINIRAFCLPKYYSISRPNKGYEDRFVSSDSVQVPEKTQAA